MTTQLEHDQTSVPEVDEITLQITKTNNVLILYAI